MLTKKERVAKRREMQLFAANYMRLNPEAKRSELKKALQEKFTVNPIWIALIVEIIKAILDHWFPKN